MGDEWPAKRDQMTEYREMIEPNARPSERRVITPDVDVYDTVHLNVQPTEVCASVRHPGIIYMTNMTKKCPLNIRVVSSKEEGAKLSFECDSFSLLPAQTELIVIYPRDNTRIDRTTHVVLKVYLNNDNEPCVSTTVSVTLKPEKDTTKPSSPPGAFKVTNSRRTCLEFCAYDKPKIDKNKNPYEDL